MDEMVHLLSNSKTRYEKRHQRKNILSARQEFLRFVNVLELLQKPLVDVSHLPNLLNRISEMECRSYCKNSLVRGVAKFLINVFYVLVLRIK